MALRNEYASLDEHIARVEALGLDGRANPAIGQSVSHQAGGFVHTRCFFTDDYIFVKNAPLFVSKDSSSRIFRMFSKSPILIKAVSFRGAWETVVGGPTATLSYSLGSSSTSFSDIVSTTNLSLISAPASKAEFSNHRSIYDGVKEVSDVYFHLRVSPITGTLAEARISKGSLLEIVWQNLNT